MLVLGSRNDMPVELGLEAGDQRGKGVMGARFHASRDSFRHFTVPSIAVPCRLALIDFGLLNAGPEE